MGPKTTDTMAHESEILANIEDISSKMTQYQEVIKNATIKILEMQEEIKFYEKANALLKGRVDQLSKENKILYDELSQEEFKNEDYSQ